MKKPINLLTPLLKYLRTPLLSCLAVASCATSLFGGNYVAVSPGQNSTVSPVVSPVANYTAPDFGSALTALSITSFVNQCNQYIGTINKGLSDAYTIKKYLDNPTAYSGINATQDNYNAIVSGLITNINTYNSYLDGGLSTFTSNCQTLKITPSVVKYVYPATIPVDPRFRYPTGLIFP